jgi:hypothetical protein
MCPRLLCALLVAGALTGCSTSGSDLPSACTTFDRGYATWQDHPGIEPSGKANRMFLTALDQAVSDAGASTLGSALQAAAAGIRELSSATTPKQTGRAHHLVVLAVAAIRKTCPAS